MKNIKTYEIFFSKPKEGDEIVEKIINIIKKENIKINYNGGYSVDIDDKIYSFPKFGFNDCNLYIYKKTQRLLSDIITGKPKSIYKISNKYWNKIVKLYENSQKNNKSDLDDLDDTHRSSKKYNL